MRSKVRMNPMALGITTLLLFPLSIIWPGPVRAQTQDRKQEIQELKDKLQQMDQMMGEVKAKISALESGESAGQPPAPTAPPTVTTTIVARSPEEEEPVGEKTFEIYGHTQLD